MKKFVTLLLVAMLLFQGLVFDVHASNIENDILLSYTSNAAPIIKNQYEKDVYAVDADYFNQKQPLSIKILDFDPSFDYTLKLYMVGDESNLIDEIKSTTSNQTISLPLHSPLKTGNYMIDLTLSNGITNVTKKIEIGYYYYYFMDVTSTYKDHSMMNAILPIKQPDFSTSGLLRANRAKLLQDDAVNIKLSNLTNFDSTKSYSYQVEYQVFENGILYNDVLINQTSFVPNETVLIPVTKISQGIHSAVQNYQLLLSIIDDDINTVVHEARIEYQLNDFLLEEGSIYDNKKDAFTTIEDKLYHQFSNIYIDDFLYEQNQIYYASVNGAGFDPTKNYYYQLSFWNENTLLSTTAVKNEEGSKLINGVPISSDLIKDATKVRMTVSEKAFDVLSNQVYYDYYLNRITLDASLQTNRTQKAIIVPYLTKKTSLEDKVMINGVLADISFTNTNQEYFKTNSKLIVKDQGNTVSEYTIIVKGDVNGDGNISMSDVIKLRKYIAGIETLTAVEQLAADVNQDRNISMSDVIKLRKHIAGIENL